MGDYLWINKDHCLFFTCMIFTYCPKNIWLCYFLLRILCIYTFWTHYGSIQVEKPFSRKNQFMYSFYSVKNIIIKIWFLFFNFYIMVLAIIEKILLVFLLVILFIAAADCYFTSNKWLYYPSVFFSYIVLDVAHIMNL